MKWGLRWDHARLFSGGGSGPSALRSRRPGPRGISCTLRRGLAAALYFSGLVGIARRLHRGNVGPLILRYHSVGGGPALRDVLVVSESHFEAQLRYLRQCYAVVPLETLLSLRAANQPLPSGTVAITFDDGYRDNHDIALPILRRYGCPATVFVVVESAQTGEAPWPQRLFGLIRSAKRPEMRVFSGSQRDVRRPDHCFDVRTPEARDATYRALKAIAARLDVVDRRALLRKIAEAAGHDGRAAVESMPEMLCWKQIREMEGHGITIGSHTMTHPRLSSLHRERADYELVESRVTLETMLGHEVRLFAYPFGTSSDFDAAVKQAVMRAGYGAACTTIEGSAGPDADPFELRRVKVRDEPVWVFATRLLTAERRSRLLAWIVGE